MTKKKYVAYYRVSTSRQGISGLGLEAQREQVEKYCNNHGEVVTEFIEVETATGKKNRPELEKAIEYCRERGYTLAIAKLDRLARSVSFIFALKDSGVDFCCCDCPDMNTLTLGVFATVAQYEAELISRRTKDALNAKRARGEKIGNPRKFTNEDRRKSSESRKQTAREKLDNQKAFKIARDLKAQGLSLNRIADRLNDYGMRGASGGKFYAATVKKLFSLFEG